MNDLVGGAMEADAHFQHEGVLTPVGADWLNLGAN